MLNQMASQIGLIRVHFFLIGLLVMLCLGAPPLYADSVGQAGYFVEPIFSLSYDPQDTNFVDVRTDKLLGACSKNVKSAQLPPHVAIFASYKTAQRRIYIVGQGDNSALFVIQNGKCKSGIPSLALSQIRHSPQTRGDAPFLSDEDVSSLFQNALERYTKAFGDKEHFFRWLDVTSERMRSGCKGLPNLWCPPTYHSLPPDLRAALASYRDGILTDPIFDLPYDRARVHFETIQSSLLLPQCKKLLLDYSSVPEILTLYAKYHTALATIFIAGTGENITIYIIRGERCEAGVPSIAMVGKHEELRWMPLKNSQPPLSEEEASSLFADALSRYSNAFGGKDAFLNWLDARSKELKVRCNEKTISCPPTYRSLPPDLLLLLDGYKKGI